MPLWKNTAQKTIEIHLGKIGSKMKGGITKHCLVLSAFT